MRKQLLVVAGVVAFSLPAMAGHADAGYVGLEVRRETGKE
jgi:hypothetical protein